MDWDTPVTLFVANIAATLPDTFVRRILVQCGTVLQWRRATGAKQEPMDFGFVDFGSPCDALQAMRVLPYITVLNRTWEVRIDSSKKQDIASFDQMRRMRADFDQDKEKRNDQLILHMVTEMIDSSAFAQVVPRLEGVLFSPNDDAREAENFRYLNDVRHENDELEGMFRSDLIEWKKEEVAMEAERAALSVDADENRQKRDEFFRSFSFPTEDDPDFIEQWTRFFELRDQYRSLKLKTGGVPRKVPDA